MLNAKTKIIITLTVLTFPGISYSEEPQTPIDFEGATWIWEGAQGEHAANNVPAGTFFFQKGFDFPAGAKPKKAEVLITCDNLWTLYINGKKIAMNDPGPDSWRRPQIIDISKSLVIEQNAIAVTAVNTMPGPAGLLVKLKVQFEDGRGFELTSDESWISSAKKEAGWNETGFIAGDNWLKAKAAGIYGSPPWARVVAGKADSTNNAPVYIKYDKETKLVAPIFKDGVVFVRGYLPFNAHDANNYIQNIHNTRAYFEMDPMTPAAIGRQLISLIPFRPDGKLTVLCDAKGGVLGSPSVSFDGKTVYFSLAKKDEAYYHIYAVDVNGNNLHQLTSGPFHDYDPVELPDGRIVFSSTRLGSREEYHAKYASSLFTCDPTGENIQPLTYHIAADREPRVTANGLLTFIRSDTFLERAKVETHLHQVRLDGTGGQVIIGPERGGIKYERLIAAEQNSNWLRIFGVGSCAPLPDGRVAAINQKGLVTSASSTGTPLGKGFLPYDMSHLPDGRLLCTAIYRGRLLVFDPEINDVTEIVAIDDLDLPDEPDENLTNGYFEDNIHSVVHLGKRKKPPVLPSMVDPKLERSVDKTGFLYCQNVLNTRQKTADLKRIKAIRIYEGRPFTLEPTKSIYEHIGTVGAELGTVPLAKDGSFYVEVPADRPLAMQAVDGEGRSVINEMSWIYVRPGEQRSCVGCHVPAAATPGRMLPSQTVSDKPLKLLGQGTPHRFRANNGANGGVLNLQLDRFREAAAINMPTSPSELLTMINNQENDIRLSAVRRMGILRDRSFAPALSGILRKERIDEIKCAAALSLSSCGTRNSISALSALLSDPDPTVQNAGRVALEHITGLQTDDFPAKPDFNAIEKSLIERISAKSNQEVQMAIEALGHIAGPAGTRAIREFLADNDDAELRLMMAAMRSLGYLRDTQSIGLLTKLMNDNLTKKGGGGFNELGFGQKPIYISATAAEALSMIATPDAEKAILDAFGKLNSFEDYVFRTAEHGWLKGCHSSILHYRMLQALDRFESDSAGTFAGKIIESLPADKDRGLLYELDSYEALSSRVISRCLATDNIVETCLAVLGDPKGKKDKSLVGSVTLSPHAEPHIRRYSPEARAAQVLSIICTDTGYAERIRQRLIKFRNNEPSEQRSWCCFYLIRTLGRMDDGFSADLLIDILENDPTEAALGLNPPPTHIIYKGWRPFYRSAAAWSLGMIKETKAVSVLLETVENLDNASSTRQQAAIALGRIEDPRCLKKLIEIGQYYPEVTTRRSILESIKNIKDNN